MIDELDLPSRQLRDEIEGIESEGVNSGDIIKFVPWVNSGE
jgi:hypothetical protein